MNGLAWTGVAVAVAAALAFSLLDPLHECGRHDRFRSIAPTRGFCRGRERSSSSSLKTLASAQADFRANDRDGDGVANFWKGDVAGLYVVAHRNDASRQPIKLIEISLAAADASPVTDLTPYATRGPKAGYWYRAIPHWDETKPDPNRFAYCAWPDTPSAGKFMYIVNENNTLFRAVATAPGGVAAFPTDAELRQSWSKID
jgi:hypothetical protein